MKIGLAGGASGGHFYPLIATVEALEKIVRDEKLLTPEIYFFSNNPYDEKLLFEHNIKFKKISAGKMRRYFSVMNFFDLFKTGWGIIKSIWHVYSVYPDVIFSKGGYASFPVLLAAKLLRIPLIIHESDSAPGRANVWAGKFARRIAVSYPQAAEFFDKSKVANTGQPIREEIRVPLKEGAKEFLKIEQNTETILVLGGSLGSEIINSTILDALPELLNDFQVIHQTGKANLESIKEASGVILANHEHKDRYKPVDFLNSLGLRMSAGASDMVISRAGSTIFEISNWALPSIIIPITESNNDHQRKNAFLYARHGACIVIEENNISAHLLISELKKLAQDKARTENMKKAALSFNAPDAANKIAREILNIALAHEA